MISATNRKLLFVAQRFPPCGGPSVQRATKFARYLPDYGYTPIVLTVAENEIDFVRDETLLDEVQHTAVYRCQGYERLVTHLPRKLGFGRVVSFFLRPDRQVWAWLPAARKMARKISREHKIEAVYTCVGPFSGVLLGQQLKRLLRVPWVVDYRDPWVDNTAGLWPSRFHFWYERQQERTALNDADAIVVATPTMRDLLAQQYPRCADRISVVYNGFDRDDIPISRSPTTHRSLHIGFAGTLMDYDANPGGVRYGGLLKAWISWFGYRHGPKDPRTKSPVFLLRAVRALLDEQPNAAAQIHLSFAGTFGENNLGLVRELGLEHVVSVKGYLPHAEAIRLLMESDVLFLPMSTEPFNRRSYNMSGKIFEYVATGRPVMATTPEGDLRDWIQRARAGWCVEPSDVDGIKRLILHFLDMKEDGSLTSSVDMDFLKRFERRELTRELAHILDSVLPASGQATLTPPSTRHTES